MLPTLFLKPGESNFGDVPSALCALNQLSGEGEGGPWWWWCCCHHHWCLDSWHPAGTAVHQDLINDINNRFARWQNGSGSVLVYKMAIHTSKNAHNICDSAVIVPLPSFEWLKPLFNAALSPVPPNVVQPFSHYESDANRRLSYPRRVLINDYSTELPIKTAPYIYPGGGFHHATPDIFPLDTPLEERRWHFFQAKWDVCVGMKRNTKSVSPERKIWLTFKSSMCGFQLENTHTHTHTIPPWLLKTPDSR